LAAVLAIAFSSAALGKQGEASVWSGSLQDNQGKPAAGAIVKLQSGGAVESATTEKDGRFSFAHLAAGEYSLSVEYRGAVATVAHPIRLPGDNFEVVVVLSPDGSLSVSPAAKPPSAEPVVAQATGGNSLSSKAVSELPLNKRDFSQLLLLAAGTMTDSNGTANFTQQFAVNGQRGTTAEFAMDGADSSDPELGGATFTNFNVDAVQEIRSSTGVMPAEIGRGAAMFTDIITRSGTNAVHGSVFEFLRNAALDARNFFDRRSIAQPGRIPPFIRNEFGFTNGGPLVIPHLYDGRDRTFYFVEYQGFRQVLGTTQVIPVPDAADRAGLDKTAYPGDTLIVPVSPLTAPLIARYPMPNDPQGPYGARTYATSSKVDTIANQFSVRLDHKISETSQLFGRFTWGDTDGPTTNPSQTAIDPSFAIDFVDRQRNAVITYTKAISPTFTSESSISYTRTTPSFPTVNRTDPALTFGDGLYEGFNTAAGSVMAAYGNLFQVRQNFTWLRGKHTLKAGGEVRANRDTTVFGISPNGQYQFGGGAAYSPVAIHSVSGLHDIPVGGLLPDSLTGLLTATAFTYTQAVAPSIFAQGAYIGDSAIRREAYNLYIQDSWKVTDRLVLTYGLRWELNTPIWEADKRTSGPVLSLTPGVLPGSELLINPQPSYKTDWNGWGPRLSLSYRLTTNTVFHAGGAITTLLPNLWQDNLLTGSTPFVVYPHLTAAPGQPIQFGTFITPQQLPVVYSTSGAAIFASGNSKLVPGNTVMDVQRFEQDLAALSPGQPITPLNISGIAENFVNGYIGTWAAGVEQKLGIATIDASYVGTAGIKLPAMDYPNGYFGAGPGFAPYTQFGSSGQILGGYGTTMLITNRSHSTYNALQVSAQSALTSSGFGFQASYTWSKSIDDASAVIGGFISGSSGAVSQTAAQNPYDTGADRGPSSFDITQSFSGSVFQDLHADQLGMLQHVSKKVTGGWQILAIGTIQTGPPFTIYSGIQQTGAGSIGTDRPDQIGTPVLSTSRNVREDYFGLGANNSSYFYIPTNVPGGTGPNQGVFGSLGRNTFRGPGMHNLDLAVIKDTPFLVGKEVMSLQFRAEFFNVFNIVNFGLPSNIVLGPGFGEISRTATNSRQIQFSLKLIF
jgi:hypothetical protein